MTAQDGTKRGRAVGWRKEEGVRSKYQMRAYPDEWELVKRFARVLKHRDKAACVRALEELESKTE